MSEVTALPTEPQPLPSQLYGDWYLNLQWLSIEKVRSILLLKYDESVSEVQRLNVPSSLEVTIGRKLLRKQTSMVWKQLMPT